MSLGIDIDDLYIFGYLAMKSNAFLRENHIQSCMKQEMQPQNIVRNTATFEFFNSLDVQVCIQNCTAGTNCNGSVIAKTIAEIKELFDTLVIKTFIKIENCEPDADLRTKVDVSELEFEEFYSKLPKIKINSNAVGYDLLSVDYSHKFSRQMLKT